MTDVADDQNEATGPRHRIDAFVDAEGHCIDLSGLLDAFALLADGLDSPRAGALQAIVTACRDKLVLIEAALDVARQEAFREFKRH
ncbi:hypothetical protein [Pannonibacter sp. SL95]|uniref:hypothetical protein n=1 Tax=Pannonibacter sp. SL95 TaxID=2995153 RepID=UPI00227557F4|nr:hypothetical protein [Pannonibacter sp. SL95]MCY1708402.1 hypothetical protein [Pannonibacter sp. SL95]